MLPPIPHFLSLTLILSRLLLHLPTLLFPPHSPPLPPIDLSLLPLDHLPSYLYTYLSQLPSGTHRLIFLKQTLNSLTQTYLTTYISSEGYSDIITPDTISTLLTCSAPFSEVMRERIYEECKRRPFEVGIKACWHLESCIGKDYLKLASHTSPLVFLTSSPQTRSAILHWSTLKKSQYSLLENLESSTAYGVNGTLKMRRRRFCETSGSMNLITRLCGVCDVLKKDRNLLWSCVGGLNEGVKRFEVSEGVIGLDDIIDLPLDPNNEIIKPAFLPVLPIFGTKNFRLKRLVKVLPEYCRVLNSRERRPWMCMMEVVDYDPTPPTEGRLIREADEEEKVEVENSNPTPPPPQINPPTPPLSESPHSSKILTSIFGPSHSTLKSHHRPLSPYSNLPGWNLLHYVIKSGEDVRLETLIMSLIKIFNQQFNELQGGAKITPYEITSCGVCKGVIECVEDSISISDLKKDNIFRTQIHTLQNMFNTVFGGEKRRGFLRSLVGYSLVCYVLQVKDRHNANILLTREGEIVHIDFGYVLGSIPKMGRIPIFSERAPFKLTKEMWEVIGGWREGGEEFCRLFDEGLVKLSEVRDEICAILLSGLISISPTGDNLQSRKEAELIVEGVRRRLTIKENARERKEFVFGLVSVAINDWGTSTYDWLQKNMNGMVMKFTLQGRSNFALATAACIGLNIGLQSLFAFMNNMKKPVAIQLREQLIVWTLVKPGVDAYRYRMALKKRGEQGVMDIQVEMMTTRVVEMVTEAGPGTVIQLAAVISSASDPAANLALLSSITTAAFMSCMMSYDWDTGKRKREEDAKFYGYMGDSAKGKIKVTLLLFFFSCFNLGVRSLSLVLLSMHGAVMATSVFVSEMALFFAVKAIRQDFQYWLPVYGVTGFVASFFGRLLTKLATDWAATVQFRHPNEVGGSYFLFSIFLTVLMGLVSAFFYDHSEAEKSSPEGCSWEESTMIRTMCFSCLGLLLSLTFLLLTIKRSYICTFTNPQTGKSYVQEKFFNDELDRYKVLIFANNENNWVPQIGSEVKIWLNENLGKWVEEKQSWFDAHYKSTIPDWIVEDEELLKEIRDDDVKVIIDKQRSMRRLSMLPVMGEEVGVGVKGGEFVK
ncbi:hypothetical protein TrLO_g8969 [Triparma laevis f. longispina]|uniref:PI3K/PI4K catalytic domain-containing protein n=1 Tax=Triparma laevis f. longispina TaxID=1714387 RepID=A0A9W7L0B7_9STRA|nr:hypothetical protein TrLO_g8969 [Triparma laevis f. longispina]